MNRTLLELGGNLDRINTTADAMTMFPEAFAIISSESDPAQIINLFDAMGFRRDRYLMDYMAWDTVTNIIFTRPMVMALETEILCIITDKDHMDRAMAIAEEVYRDTDIKLVQYPHTNIVRYHESDLKIFIDAYRTQLWMTRGWKLYNPFIKWRRMPQIRRNRQIVEELLGNED